ncbi:monovalent cation/H+ antiporter subunit A [Paracoccus suum]|nr:monovalent cation/H+ antiporter subunit A [Paracoccus suum]
MQPLLIALLPFLGALFPGLMVRSGRDAATWATALPTGLAMLGVMLHLPALMRGEVILQHVAWLPQIGLEASFRLDGLSAFFAIMILGIGLLITLYARFYLSREDGAGRFFTFLLLFQGAMTGLVLSDNILLLLIFWELTSLSSFLLIGYWGHDQQARRGARMALAVTAAGGLAMIAGMLILGRIAGSYQITGILAARDLVMASSLRLPAMLLILTGAFAKSAQVPFHFWLPRAMAAPTPVSAYLHSATMVKAGLFLMARLWPVFAPMPEWQAIVPVVGLITMVAGAAFALGETDLKGLLAWSTVSHLGLITMLLGLGTQPAAEAAMLHILNHALFKAPLFMIAGIVDHAAHTRDLRRLGGLWRIMPLTFVLALLASLSMAGVPLLGGFLSKELMLEAVMARGPVFTVLALVAALLSAAYSFRFVWGTFLGRPRSDGAAHAHAPGVGLWLAPALLVIGAVAVGLQPMLAAPAVDLAAGAVTDSPVHVHLAVWHGLTPALALSAIALLGAFALLAVIGGPVPRGPLPVPDAERLFWRVIPAAEGAAARFGEALQNGSMARALAVLVGLALALTLAAALAGSGLGPQVRALTPVAPAALIGWGLAMLATAALAALHRDRLLALVMIGIVGLMVSLGFAWLSAPDLALTQISVEVVTIVLMLLALNFLPNTDPVEDSGPRRRADMVLAGAAGLGMTALIYALMRRDFAFPTISEFHAQNSYLGGGGHNIVNVILVDFRGYDTFGEITVLGIAALVIYALAQSLLGRAHIRQVIAASADQLRAGDRHPLMMIVGSRLMLPLALVVAMFIFLRGHNAPGGGFVAGLVVSIGLVMQYMASGFGWAQERVRIPYHTLIGAGVAIAAATGIGAWANGKPFMTSAFGYVTLPGFEPIELATAALFDLGVFVTVLGAVMLALASLSRLGVAARSDEPEV